MALLMGRHGRKECENLNVSGCFECRHFNSHVATENIIIPVMSLKG
jgi:hypothetical protein